MAPLLSTVAVLFPFVASAGSFAVFEARDYVRPGRGRHRRVVRGRHALRGGRA